jgi:Sigma-70, region 4
LREQGLSYREIAQRMHCSISTAHSYVAAGAPEIRPVPGLQDEHGKPVAGAEPGNTRSLTHGAYSAKRIEPRAAELVESAKATVPWLAEPSFEAAVRAWPRAEASVGLLVEYLDRVGMLDEDGEPRSAVNALLKFERTAADARPAGARPDQPGAAGA